MVATSDFKNRTVVNSEIIFLFFRFGFKHFCKNMKYHFLVHVFHLRLVLHMKDETIYCTIDFSHVT